MKPPPTALALALLLALSCAPARTGAGARRANDIRGREAEWLAEKGWRGLDAWDIRQEDFLEKEDEANQFVLVDVDPDGSVRIQPRFLDENEPDGTRHGASVALD